MPLLSPRYTSSKGEKRHGPLDDLSSYCRLGPGGQVLVRPPARWGSGAHIHRARRYLCRPCGLDRGSSGKLEQEGRSLPCLRLEPDVPAHSADELVADVEPQPRAADAAGHVRIYAVELLEDPALLVGGNPEPLVSNVEEHVLLLRLDSQLYPAAVGRVLHR